MSYGLCSSLPFANVKQYPFFGSNGGVGGGMCVWTKIDGHGTNRHTAQVFLGKNVIRYGFNDAGKETAGFSRDGNEALFVKIGKIWLLRLINSLYASLGNLWRQWRDKDVSSLE